jgi:hypothetical protein
MTTRMTARVRLKLWNCHRALPNREPLADASKTNATAQKNCGAHLTVSTLNAAGYLFLKNASRSRAGRIMANNEPESS